MRSEPGARRPALTRLAPLAAFAFFCAASAGSAGAHEDHALNSAAQRWTWDPWALPFVLALAGVYVTGVVKSWRRKGVGQGVRRWQALCFTGSWLVLIIALLSPIDALSEILFSAHMAQHELLMLIAAPLFVLAAPYRAFVQAIPASYRPRVLAALRRRTLRSLWRAVTTPVVVLALQLVVLSVWHIPSLFDAALRLEPVHALQHALFFGAAALFWWTLASGRYGPLGYGAGLLFVFITALHGGTLGALLTLARGTWYPLHAERTAAAGLDALEDQQLAGLLMWVPGGVVLLSAALALGFAWLGAVERKTAR